MRTSILWKSQISILGHDYCTIQNVGNDWELYGTALLMVDNFPSHLNYSVHCDRGWKTSYASVEGYVGKKSVSIRVKVSESRDWIVNGQPQADLKGCLDIDLGFTPATNTLPILRLDLRVGDAMKTTAAWLKFPGFGFSALDQEYSHISDSEYLYQSGNRTYSAVLSVNSAGFVTSYPELWDQEGTT